MRNDFYLPATLMYMYVSYQHQPHVYINGVVQHTGPELISCSFSVWYNNVTTVDSEHVITICR